MIHSSRFYLDLSNSFVNLNVNAEIQPCHYAIRNTSQKAKHASDVLWGEAWPQKSPECFMFLTTVASLGWVTPGAATEGVTPLFFLKSLATCFCSSLSLSLSLFIAFTRVSPPRVCHPTPFLPVRARFSSILCKFAHNFFSFGCHPPWRVSVVSPGAPPPQPPPLPVTPLAMNSVVF